MAKSGGIPYFLGQSIAHNAEITDMQASVQPVIKIYPRNIGGVLKGGGVVSKTITLACRVIPPEANTTRGDVEQFMNTWNETYGIKIGTLRVDDNEYLDCGINNVTYEPDITDGFLRFTVEFALGVQSETLDYRQLIPGELYDWSRGRKAWFVAGGKTFHFWHNVDIVRNLENRLAIELYDIHNKDSTIKFNGGFETVTAYCWVVAPEDSQEDGWKQTVGAYIYNIMNGPLGEIGKFYLGGNVIENCLFTDVNLVECYPTGARYELKFLVSLQC